MAHKLTTIGSFDGNKTILTKTADLGSFHGTFQQKKYQISKVAHKLPTIGSFDGTKTIVTQTADLGSFNGTFQQGGTFGQQTADLGSFDGTFQQS